MAPREPTDTLPRGDFYVDASCCMSCGVPQAISPDLVGWRHADGLTSCGWIKQPQTPDELDRAIQILHTQEVGCHRYAGTNPEILSRLPRQECDYYNPRRPPVHTARLQPSERAPNSLFPGSEPPHIFVRLVRKLFRR